MSILHTWTSLVAQLIKNLPALQETWVRFLGQEYPLEKEMATHSSVLAWRIPWIEEAGGLQSIGLHSVGHNQATKQQQHGKPLGHSDQIRSYQSLSRVRLFATP